MNEVAGRAYVLDTVGEVGDVLGWAPTSPPVVGAVEDATLALRVTSLDEAPELAARLILRREAWRRAAASLAGRFDYEADGGKFSRSQLYAQAAAQLQRATTDAYAVDLRVEEQEIDYHDPYAPVERG